MWRNKKLRGRIKAIEQRMKWGEWEERWKEGNYCEKSDEKRRL